MARINKSQLTKAEILIVASQLFLSKGYSKTTVKAISQELEMSTGNITFYYPTKEHILAELTHLLCDFQLHLMEVEANEGVNSVMALCLELAAMASICEEDEVMKDMYLSAYTNLMPLEIIRRNDACRAKNVFAEYCPDWTDERFEEAENLVSGIEYATLMTTGGFASLEGRIRSALDLMLSIYNVPEDIRKTKIAKVMALDYRDVGRKAHSELKDYIANKNEQLIEEIIHTSA